MLKKEVKTNSVLTKAYYDTKYYKQMFSRLFIKYLILVLLFISKYEMIFKVLKKFVFSLIRPKIHIWFYFVQVLSSLV